MKYFDGPNDGLVGEESFRWGQNYQFLTVSGKRGISHGDMIDLNRENIKGFDVREFYVQLVVDLRRWDFDLKYIDKFLIFVYTRYIQRREVIVCRHK